MAKGETVGGLYLRLGLSYDELNQDFVKVEQTISENVQRLNRESKLIRLKADIDLANVTDAAEKLKIQQQALTRQIEAQIQKVKLYEASWKSAAASNGEASKQAQNAAISLKQQELALSKLQQQLREVTAQQQELAKSSTRISGGLLGGYNSMKGNAAGSIGKLTSAFQGVKDAAGSADGAITKALDIIDAIPSPVGKAVAALAAIPLVVKGIENSLLDMAKPAMSSGDALYAMSRGMQMEIADAAQLSTICKVTGIELSEVAATTRRVGTALTKTDEKTTLMKRTLQQYGVELKNSNGELKNTLDMSIALAEGLKKAQAEGRGKEFIASVFGRFFSGDYITYLEDLSGNIALAKKVVRNGLADPALAHEVQGNMNALNTQIEQLSGAFSYAFLPVANKIIPRTMEQFGELTKIIAENKDGIQVFGTAMTEVVGTIGSVAMTATNNVIRLVGALGELVSNKAKKDSVIDKYVNDEKIKSLEDLVAAELQQNYTHTERISIESNPALYQQTLAHYQPMFKALEEARKKVEDDTQNINSALNSVADFSAIGQERRATGFDDKLASLRETMKILNEASDIMFKLNHTDYENKKLDLARWRQDLLNAENMTAEQREAYEKLYVVKSAQIEKDRADKLAEIRDSVAAADRTSIQNQIAEIYKKRDAWIAAGMEEADATELAQRLIAKAYEERDEKLNEIRDSVERLGRTELENSFVDIDKKKGSWVDTGMDEAEAEILANRLKLEEINKLETAFSEARNELWQSDLEKQLARIEKERQAWIDKGIDETRAEELAGEARTKVFESAAENISDKIEALESLEEQRAAAIQQFEADVARNIDSIWQTSLENRLDEIEREKRAWIKKGLDEVKAEKWAEQAKAEVRRNAAMSVLQSELKEFRIYREGGYRAVREYQLSQLYKQGIRPEELRITPEQLQGFKRTQMIARNSLLPNLMTDSDKSLAQRAAETNRADDLYSRWIGGDNIRNLKAITGNLDKSIAKAAKELNKLADEFSAAREKFSGTPTETPEVDNSSRIVNDLISTVNDRGEVEIKTVPRAEPTIPEPPVPGIEPEANLPLSDVTEKFVALSSQIEDVSGKLVDFGTAIENIAQIEPPTIEVQEIPFDTSEIFAAFEELVSPMGEVNAQFAELTNQLIEVTSGFADFVSALNQFSAPQQNQAVSQQVQSAPPNITVTVQIDEAHAWDSQHIQELADKVADKIEPELVNAIGGDSNRY